MSVARWTRVLAAWRVGLSYDRGMTTSDLQRQADRETPRPDRLPRWRGFNLLNLYSAGHPERHSRFVERDFEWIAAWGFDFVRLPMSYLCWSSYADMKRIDESQMAIVDEAVEFGRRHGLHVNLNLHRIPGFCINAPKEPLSLWQDEAALDAACHHWAHLARRYVGLPNARVSFDLINEPNGVDGPNYARVVRRLCEAIWAEDPQRLVVADGIDVGNTPVFELAGAGVAQSTRGYTPMHVSHWRARWVQGSDAWPEPTWPLVDAQGKRWDRAALRERIEPWRRLADRGVGVHVGEFGAHRYTPHKVALAWLEDWLSLWNEAGWGWALWQFRGDFGVLDSGRTDVAYEDFHGHKLDRAMLELLRAH